MTPILPAALRPRLAAVTYGRFLPRIVQNVSPTGSARSISARATAPSSGNCSPPGSAKWSVSSPPLAPIEAADPSLRPLIRHDIFRPNSFRPSSLSLITCFQTIEHLADPLTFCRDAWRPLKPGGALFLIGHNRRAVSAKLLGRKSPIFDIEHMQLFSATSIRNLLKAADFPDVEVRTSYNRYPVRYWAQLFPFPKRMKMMLNMGLPEVERVGRVIIPLPAGNLAAVAYK